MKKLKYLVLAFVMSFAFILAGCGGDGQLGARAEANIGNPENYAVATADDKTALTNLLNNEEAVNVPTYRISANMGMEDMSMDMNCIFNVSQDNFQMACKVTASQAGQNMTIKFWVDEGVAYMQYFGQYASIMKQVFGSDKIKEAFEGSDAGDTMEALEGLDFESIVERAKEMDFSNEDIVVKVNVEGETKRFELSNTTNASAKIYLVFESNKLTSAQFELAEGAAGLGATTIVVSAYDGEIEFPDFNSFVDASEIGY